MTLKQIKFLLWTTAVVMTGGTAFVAVQTSRLTEWAAIVEIPKPSAGTTGQAQLAELPPLNELQSLCLRDLRAPLYDAPPAPPPAKPPPPPPPAPPPFTLAGTVIETGHSRAILVMADGKVQFSKIGDATEGALLTQINRDSVTVKYQDKDVVLRVEKKQ